MKKVMRLHFGMPRPSGHRRGTIIRAMAMDERRNGLARKLGVRNGRWDWMRP